MEELSFNTTQNVDIVSNKAGIGDRFIAAILDYLIISGTLIISFRLYPALSNVTIYYILTVFIGLVFFFYHFFFEVFMNGQSIGKKYRKIKVIDQSGQNANIGQLFIRALIRPIDLLGIGLIFIAFTSKSQRIGDLAAGTLVVQLKKDIEMDELAFSDVEPDYQPVYPRTVINNLKPSDIELIKEVLDRKVKRMDYSLVKVIFNKTKEITGITPENKAVPFLKDIIKDYNYYNG